MPDEINRLQLKKKGQRQISPFVGNGLLYDYMTGLLDDERKTAVEAYLESSREAQQDVQKIHSGQQYTEKLKHVTISEPLQKRLSTPSSYLNVLFKKSRFDQWPVGLKWGLEAVVVVFVIVTVLTVAPWEKVMKLKVLTGANEVVLTELNKVPPVKTEIQGVPEPVETPQFVDEDIKKEPSVSSTPVPTASVAAVVKASPTPEVKKSPTKVAVVAPEMGSEETAQEEGVDSSKVPAGYLFRGKIDVTNLEAIVPKITEKILELGGRKAGAVELGWIKTPGSAYFHFTFPEAKYEELQAFLSGYGTARISKEKHPRVMPDGIIRLIITVDEAKK